MEVEVVSLNCWGLKYISSLTDERIDHIASFLHARDPDIVCLQEIWQQRHWRVVSHRLRDTHPYAKYFYSGIFGSGLAILSKYPITQTQMRGYTLNGRPQAFWRGDWYVGKGVASAVVDLPDGRQMQLFNTHMHAPYNEKVDTYLCHRIAQGWELRKILRASVMAGYITFVTGDFNSVPGSLVHRFLTTDLSDTFLTLNPDTPLFPPENEDGEVTCTASEVVDVYGCTCDVSPTNTWRRMQAPTMRAKRLDYIFHDNQVTPLACEVVLTEPIPEVGCSASDHFGLACRYRIHGMMADAPVARLNHAADVAKSEYGRGRPSLSRRGTRRSVYRYRPTDERDFEEIDRHLAWYVRRERRHAKLRLLHFYLAAAAFVGAQVGAYFVSRGWPALLLSFANSVNLVAGVADGALATLFGWWELRSLREFGDEVRAARELHAHRHLLPKSPGVPLPSELLEPASPVKGVNPATLLPSPPFTAGRATESDGVQALQPPLLSHLAAEDAAVSGTTTPVATITNPRAYGRSRAYSNGLRSLSSRNASSTSFHEPRHRSASGGTLAERDDVDDPESERETDVEPSDDGHSGDENEDEDEDEHGHDEVLEKRESAGEYLTAKYSPTENASS